MHSITTRAYSIVSQAGTVLLACAVLSAVTAPLLFDTTAATASAGATVHAVTSEREFRDRVDFARVTLDIDADLGALFNWHTQHVFLYVVAEYAAGGRRNEVTLWDRVLASPSEARFSLRGERPEYPLVDAEGAPGALLGANVTIVPKWNVVTITGLLPTARGTPSVVQIPARYTTSN